MDSEDGCCLSWCDALLLVAGGTLAVLARESGDQFFLYFQYITFQ
jgi:hypothetical protein